MKSCLSFLMKYFSFIFNRANKGTGEVIKSITMVGAITEGGELSYIDREYLDVSLKLMASNGIGVLSNFNLTVINLDSGGDFISYPSYADLLILCRIFHSAK